MGKIVRNGIEFSSTSDTANNINYDNSQSGLSAVTAQEAIDEVNENVSTLTESLEEVSEKLEEKSTWKIINSRITSTNPFNTSLIPADAKELLIIAHSPYYTFTTIALTRYVPALHLGNEVNGIIIDAQKIQSAKQDSKDSTSSAYVDVYYR